MEIVIRCCCLISYWTYNVRRTYFNFRCEKFHYYVYGKEFNIESATAHYSILETNVLKKRGISIRLTPTFSSQATNLSSQCNYIPGKELIRADAFSMYIHNINPI